MIHRTGNDVDHTINRICPPHGCAGTADNFNAFDVAHDEVVLIPINAAKQ